MPRPLLGYARGMRLLVLVPVALLLLASCSPKPLEQLRGQVRDWPGVAGQVSATDDQGRPLTTTTADSVGRFTLPLPTDEQMKPLLRPDVLQPSVVRAVSSRPGVSCTGRLSPSNPAARFYLVGWLGAAPGSGPALRLVSQNPSDRPSDPVRLDRRLLIYADAASRVQGTQTCTLPGGALTYRYSLNLKVGWNYAVTHRTDYASGQKERVVESVGKEGFEGWVVAPGNAANEP
jgi:hypothetical protein